MLVALGAWAATALGTVIPVAITVRIAGAAVVAMVVARRRPRAVALTAGVAAGSLAAAWHVAALHRGPVPRLAARHDDVEVVARLVRDPQLVTTRFGQPLMLADATVTSVRVTGWSRAGSPVLILADDATGWTGLLPGQRLDVSGRLEPARRGDDVAAVLSARAPPLLVGRPPVWQRAAGRIRSALDGAVSGLPSDARGLVPGLVDGDTSELTPDLKLAMRRTGLTHLEAVSGENVTIVLMVVLAVAPYVGLRRRGRVLLCALTLVGFVVLARPTPSVLRAAVMGGLALLAMATGRRVAPLSALSMSVAALVVIDPFLARSVGFVLSVAATAGLLLLAPPLADRLSRRMPRWLALAVAVPLAAQLACLPVLVLAFGQLTPYAVPANLLAAVAVAPATIAGLLAAVVAVAWQPAGAVVAWIGALPALWIASVARALSALPGAGLRWSPWVAAACCVLVTAGVVVMVRRRRLPRGDRAILAA